MGWVRVACIALVIAPLLGGNALAQTAVDAANKREGAANSSVGDVANARPPRDQEDLRRWLENMVWYHRFSREEIRAATGLSLEQIDEALRRFDIRPDNRPPRPAGAPLLMLPYPGGRHPRLGFLDGAVRPQRETKLSVFLPWDPAAYVVLDVPEAIRRHDEARHGLLYLAHTHVPTMWTKQGVQLEPLEWRQDHGAYVLERTLPNGVTFGTRAVAGRDVVEMEMWLRNGSDQPLRELRVQNCVLLGRAPPFAGQTNDNKLFRPPYAACRSPDGRRWIITAWWPHDRSWGNARCPCMHSDPRFPDCGPGQTQRVVGRLWFYEGEDIEAELQRLDRTRWWQQQSSPRAVR